jgi:hypothetical protein
VFSEKAQFWVLRRRSLVSVVDLRKAQFWVRRRRRRRSLALVVYSEEAQFWLCTQKEQLGALRRRSPVLVEYSEKAQFWLCTKQKLNLGYEEEEARFCLSTQKKPNFGYLEEARFWFCTQRSPILGTKKKKLSVVFVLRLSLGVKNYLDSDNMIQGRRSSCSLYRSAGHQRDRTRSSFDGKWPKR